MSTPEKPVTATDYDDLTHDMTTSENPGPFVTVSAALLRHEAEFIAALRLPERSFKKDQPLTNVLLEVGNGVLHLTATDGKAIVFTRIPVSGLDSFFAVVTGEKFYEACVSLPEGDAQLTYEEGSIILNIKAFRYKFKDCADVVQVIRSHTMVGASGQTAVVSAGSVLRVVEQAAPFAPKDRYSRTERGVFLSILNSIKAFAIDSYRAINATAPDKTAWKLGHVFVAREYLPLLLNITPAMDDTLIVGIHGNDLRVECAPRIIVLRDARRINVHSERLFASLPPVQATVTVNVNSLLLPLKKLALVCLGSVRSVELSVEPKKLTLRASRELIYDEIMSGGLLEGEEEIEAETTGFGACVINARNLLQFIKPRSGQLVTIYIPAHGNIVLVSSGETQFLTTTVRVPEPNAEPERA